MMIVYFWFAFGLVGYGIWVNRVFILVNRIRVQVMVSSGSGYLDFGSFRIKLISGQVGFGSFGFWVHSG